MCQCSFAGPKIDLFLVDNIMTGLYPDTVFMVMAWDSNSKCKTQPCDGKDLYLLSINRIEDG